MQEVEAIQAVPIERINELRSRLPFLEQEVTAFCEDGIRYTFLPPKPAFGFTIEVGCIRPSYGAGLKSFGAWHRPGFLWPIEQFLYAQERSRIIAEVLRELPRSCALGPKDPEKTWEFLQDFNMAMQATEAKWALPKPKSAKKLQIKRISNYWWLFHRSWMPLCFDSFEEAAKFASRYVMREKAA